MRDSAALEFAAIPQALLVRRARSLLAPNLGGLLGIGQLHSGMSSRNPKVITRSAIVLIQSPSTKAVVAESFLASTQGMISLNPWKGLNIFQWDTRDWK